jgi:hypothetical protein
MNLNRPNDLRFSKYFINILPLATHSSYTQDLEFSDKIVLPRSVLKALQRLQIPAPPQFLIVSERPFHNNINCTALEYSAEEDFIYLPFWMLSELGYKVLNTNKGTSRNVKAGYGLTLSTLDVVARHNVCNFLVPKAVLVEYYLDFEHNCSDVRRELGKYLFVREGSDVSVFVQGRILIVKITKVLPAKLATLDDGFELKRVEQIPVVVQPIAEKEEREEIPINPLSQTEKFSSQRDRIPKFLKDLLKKQESQKSDYFVDKKPKVIHRKNLTCLPPESPRIITQRESTPEIIEKYIQTSNKAMETGKSIEDYEWHLPSVYNSPMKLKVSPPTLLTITIPEYPAKFPMKAVKKVPRFYKTKKDRSVTPLILKNIRLDISSHLFNADSDQRYLKGVKLFNH